MHREVSDTVKKRPCFSNIPRDNGDILEDTEDVHHSSEEEYSKINSAMYVHFLLNMAEQFLAKVPLSHKFQVVP